MSGERTIWVILAEPGMQMLLQTACCFLVIPVLWYALRTIRRQRTNRPTRVIVVSPLPRNRHTHKVHGQKPRLRRREKEDHGQVR